MSKYRVFVMPLITILLLVSLVSSAQQTKAYGNSMVIALPILSQTTLAQKQVPRLAFESFANGNWDIYVWDRSGFINVTNSPNNEYNPIWSNDGRLAYFSVDIPLDLHMGNLGWDSDLYIWNGKTVTRIAQAFRLQLPVWSSDGKLAYVGKVGDSSYHVFVWDGSQSIDVLPEGMNSDSPVWSTDGRLAFNATTNYQTEVYVWDGKTVKNISQLPQIDSDPAWSADGQLAFASYGNGKGRTLYVWNGKTLTNVWQNPGDDYDLGMTWSTDGKLAYLAQTAQPIRNGVANPNDVVIWDGTTTRHILKGVYPGGPLGWSPDNQLLISYHDAQYQRKTVLWDGQSFTNITTEIVQPRMIRDTVFAPAWNAKGQLALSIEVPGGPHDMGPMPVDTIHIWEDGKLTPVKLFEPSSDTTSFDNPEFAVWSSDNLLAVQAAKVRRDQVDGFKLLVWDGNKAVEVSPIAKSSNQYPVWEPGK